MHYTMVLSISGKQVLDFKYFITFVCLFFPDFSTTILNYSVKKKIRKKICIYFIKRNQSKTENSLIFERNIKQAQHHILVLLGNFI